MKMNRISNNLCQISSRTAENDFLFFFISMNVPLCSYTFTGVGYDLMKTTLNTATSAKATLEN